MIDAETEKEKKKERKKEREKEGKRERKKERNKAVYTVTPVAGGWAGAVMSLAGALTAMKYSYLIFSTFKLLKNAKKAKWDRRTDGPTDRHGDL